MLFNKNKLTSDEQKILLSLYLQFLNNNSERTNDKSGINISLKGQQYVESKILKLPKKCIEIYKWKVLIEKTKELGFDDVHSNTLLCFFKKYPLKQ